ncbi:hypothetical protein EB241_17680 [Erwinia psidii]|uniref:Uncharacterized protein n=1 Tax=Erwinia psidii TaxID=69224 RepID=A0A3N6UM67_9GAMM|nr:hypothetical protein EB241_17680 [Erwinia psidii]
MVRCLKLAEQMPDLGAAHANDRSDEKQIQEQDYSPEPELRKTEIYLSITQQNPVKQPTFRWSNLL